MCGGIKKGGAAHRATPLAAQSQKKHVHLTAKWRMPTRSKAQVLTVEML